MKLQTSVNELVLSNIATTGEFRIRNSAKAFSILSSGLYSNKIKAVIRELSCNAVDSHVAAGKEDIPFEVHLPSELEPWFSVKDFGVGLDFEGVTEIYTTYFESTKTDSNAFIGALGLGSKSPFSYTDNFSITAIKDGTERIFSAFINEAGIPSVAEMASFSTDEQNGVEIKFSVSDSRDYFRFRDEAAEVFLWFKLKPIVEAPNYRALNITYVERDIIPGVHLMETRRGGAIAVMGNIAYPLSSMPNKSQLGVLEEFLKCNLEFNFDIGELDFAASREEISFIPTTVEAIRKKLQELSDKSLAHLTKKAKEIKNLWERAAFLKKRFQETFYRPSVAAYIKQTNFKLVTVSSSYANFHTFKLDVDAVKSDFGIELQYYRERNQTVTKSKTPTRYDSKLGRSVPIIEIQVDDSTVFVLDDLKKGTQSRIRYHFGKTNLYRSIIVLRNESPDMALRLRKYKEFLDELKNPPTVIKSSELSSKPTTKKSESSPAFLKANLNLKPRGSVGWTDSISLSWADIKHIPPSSQKHKYVAMNCFTPLKKVGDNYIEFKFKDYLDLVSNSYIPFPSNIEVYGVRKRKLKEVESLPNWELLTDYFGTLLGNMTIDSLEAMAISEVFDNSISSIYTSDMVAKCVNPGSKYLDFIKFKKVSVNLNSVASKNTLDLCQAYQTAIDIPKLRERIKLRLEDLKNLYPMLGHIGYNSVNEKAFNAVSEYINLVDSSIKCNA